MKKTVALVLICVMLLSTLAGCAATPQTNDNILSNDDVKLMTSEEVQESVEYPVEKAYVRDGSYNNKNWRVIIQERGLNQNNQEPLIFKTSSTGFNRYVYFTFDISSFKTFMYNAVYFKPAFSRVGGEGQTTYKIYLVDADSWDTDTITWSNQPYKSGENELIAENCVMSGLTSVDLTDAVDKAIVAGKSKISFVMVADKQIGDGENILDWRGTTLTATTSTAGQATYVKNLVSDETANKAIWDWAQQVYDEWYVRYTELLKRGDAEADLIPVDSNEYTKSVVTTGSGITGYNSSTLETVKWKDSDFSRTEPTRTIDTLIGLGEYSDYDVEQTFDVYGGLIDEQMRQEATGFFYSTKIGDRWWIIDPLGYPCYIRAVSGVGINYLGSSNQELAALEKYGTAEKWGLAATRQLKDKWYFNASTSNGADLTNVESRLIYQGSVSFAASYGTSIGTNSSVGGSTTFSGNNTMNVFDPAFVDFCDTKAQSVVDTKDDEWLLGRTVDNELPMDANMLYNYLQLSPTDSTYHYSYACAWTWFTNITGKENPTDDDITEELMQLFIGFVYDRYYSIVSSAIRKYDPNHMVLGSRMLDSVINKPWVLRFASLHLDCLTINWYGEWDIPVEELKLASETSNLPLMVTEFYTKAMDSGLDNTRGAGWVVKTQQDRGDFYQCYTLRLLECKNFVGWHWFQYIDNDPDPSVIYTTKDGVKTWRDQSSVDANKGMVDNNHEPYEDLVNAMAEINKNVYKLIEHFDAKYATK